jgi:hypothetical protein
MYESVAAATEAIGVALAGVVGVRYYRQLGGSVDPPATVLPPPRLVWGRMGSAPTDATFTVGLIVDRDGREVERLEALLQPVVDALEDLDDVVVTSADLGSYPAGGVELPAWLITLEVAL